MSTKRKRTTVSRESLTAQQLAEVKDAFNVFDRNHDGTISAAELECVLQMLGNNPSKSDIQAIMTKVDKNANGKIEFDEFIQLMTDHMKDFEDEERELLAAFQVFDKNGDKTISAGEIRSIMKAIGSPLTTADVDQLLSLADTNADGAINYEEYVKLMLRKRSF